nr:hypothetical protein GCM10025730_09350 [Promicromonospora thailandica]
MTLFGDADPVLTADIERTGATVRHDDLDPLVQLVQAQRLAVEVARSRGLDADTPATSRGRSCSADPNTPPP